ncbi:hypothetical protein AKJ16_DCAP17340 [Drosera capensis]
MIRNLTTSLCRTAHEGHSGCIRWNYDAGMDGVVLGDVSGQRTYITLLGEQCRNCIWMYADGLLGSRR